jgi:A/G-specific adenine glycosylase
LHNEATNIDLTACLLAWYEVNGRKDLPWQHIKNPYFIWVSEIMLQQTQVKTVIPYFERFIARFPDVVTLAESDIDDVLHQWTGLGYYARGRNLHRAAKIICNEYQGNFPKDFKILISLPGIGRSTAGAILALAFDQRHPILDGNVKRVLARYHAIVGWSGQKQVEKHLWELADKHTPPEGVARYTQAIMDLGATVCTRKNPGCNDCPLRDGCLARLQDRQHELPISRPKKVLPIRNTVFLILENEQGEILLERRPPAGIWGGLWCFPECAQHIDIQEWIKGQLGLLVSKPHRRPYIRHTFSHFHLEIAPVHVQLLDYDNQVKQSVSYCWYHDNNGEAKGMPAPVKQLLDELQNKIAGVTNEQNGPLCEAR